MKIRIIVLLCLLSFGLSACKEGAESIPELSGRLFQALQSASQGKLKSIIPSVKTMEKAYTLYFAAPGATKDDIQKQAIDKAASLRVNLIQDFNQMLNEAKDKQIDWKTAELKDFKYTENDRKEGHKEAKVRMILQTGKVKNVVLYNGIRIEDRWYLYDLLQWEE